MKLVYTKDNGTHKAGDEVKIGHTVQTGHRNVVTVDFFRPPHKPSSEGKISIKHGRTGPVQEVYVSVIGAEWIEREDRDPLRYADPIVDDTAEKVGRDFRVDDTPENQKYTLAIGANDSDTTAMILVTNKMGEAFQIDIVVRGKTVGVVVEDLNRQNEEGHNFELA